MMEGQQMQKIDLTPKRHHGYAVILFIMGTLFPPMAVAARFGFGGDFWLNLLLTICGYIPGHGHNFYIQNIRNNKNHSRTPKWAQRYGLVDTSEIRRKERKSQWANRYNDRLPQSTLEGQPYAEGQDQTSSTDLSSEDHSRQRQGRGDLWRPEDENYYKNDNASSTSGGRWHYPANFEDAAPAPTSSKRSKKKKDKKDRWARTEDAYSISEERERKKKKKKSRSNASLAGDSVASRDDQPSFPEDAEGGLYGERPQRSSNPENGNGNGNATKVDDVFNHQF